MALCLDIECRSVQIPEIRRAQPGSIWGVRANVKRKSEFWSLSKRGLVVRLAQSG